MNHSIPAGCPACGNRLHIKTLVCPACTTEISGDFPLSGMLTLPAEHLHFLEVFIRCRGSLKDVGAELSISYPTARNRLDALIEALGLEPAQSRRQSRMDILTRLKENEITVEQALGLMGARSDD